MLLPLLLLAIVASAYAQSDSELSAVAELIYTRDKDGNAPAPGDVQFNTDGPRLFTYVNEGKLYALPTYAKYLKLMDNYVYMVGTPDGCDNCVQEEEDFLNAVLSTSAFGAAWSFLQTHGLASSDATEFKQELRNYWFRRYSRSGGDAIDSSGFEHVFIGEVKKGKVSGFHNWVHFYEQEKKGNLQYGSLIRQCEPNMLTITFDWNGYEKPIGGHFMNTSPEFDFALFTICYLARTNTDCRITLSGQPVIIKTFTFDGISIGSSYPNC